MSKVVVREGETLDEALRRFKRQVNKAGTIQDLKDKSIRLALSKNAEKENVS